jgi:PPOX class probable F420-dependent enzyme
VRLAPEVADALLERWPVARLATLSADGRPHLVPIVFARRDGALWSPVDGKPKGGGELARVRNLRERPRVSVLLDHYDADWRRLWWLRVDGRARAVEGAPDAGDAELAAVAAALRAKYPQYAEWPLFRGRPLLLRIAIDALRSWCAGAEGLREAQRASRP